MEENVQAKEANQEFKELFDEENEQKKKQEEQLKKTIKYIKKNPNFIKFNNALESLCLDKHKSSVLSCATNGQLFTYDGKLLLEGLDNIDQNTVQDKNITIKDKKLDYIKLYKLMKSGKLIFIGDNKLPQALSYNKKTGQFEPYIIDKKKEDTNLTDREPLKWYKIGIAIFYAVFAFFKAIINRFRQPRLIKEYRNNIDKCTQEYACANMMNRQEEVNLVDNKNLNKEVNLKEEKDKSIDNDLFPEDKDLHNLINNEESIDNIDNSLDSELNKLNQEEAKVINVEDLINSKKDNLENTNNIDNENNIINENNIDNDIDKETKTDENIVDNTKEEKINNIKDPNDSIIDLTNKNEINTDNINNDLSNDNIINTNQINNDMSFSDDYIINENPNNKTLIDQIIADPNAEELIPIGNLENIKNEFFEGMDIALFELPEENLEKDNTREKNDDYLTI